MTGLSCPFSFLVGIGEGVCAGVWVWGPGDGSLGVGLSQLPAIVLQGLESLQRWTSTPISLTAFHGSAKDTEELSCSRRTATKLGIKTQTQLQALGPH